MKLKVDSRDPDVIVPHREGCCVFKVLADKLDIIDSNFAERTHCVILGAR